MSNLSQKQWIVLVNKIPVGPLSESEINNYLQTNQISRNDLCYEIKDGDNQPEWKLLWQNTEFDRRKEIKGEKGADISESKGKLFHEEKIERRVELDPEIIKKNIINSISQELNSVTPDELINYIKGNKNNQGKDQLGHDMSDPLSDSNSFLSSEKNSHTHVWRFVIFICVISIGITYYNLIIDDSEAPSTSQKEKTEPKENALANKPLNPSPSINIKQIDAPKERPVSQNQRHFGPEANGIPATPPLSSAQQIDPYITQTPQNLPPPPEDENEISSPPQFQAQHNTDPRFDTAKRRVRGPGTKAFLEEQMQRQQMRDPASEDGESMDDYNRDDNNEINNQGSFNPNN